MKKLIDTLNENYKLRYAEVEDIPLVLQFIKELASYEKLLNEVTATEEILKESLFEKNIANVLIGEYEGKPVSFALFFYNFSTFLGRPGIYLEDFYVKPEMRGKGFGKMIIAYLARLAVEGNYSRIDWSVLNWNKSAIAFYEKIGAVPLLEWNSFRLTGENLISLANKS